MSTLAWVVVYSALYVVLNLVVGAIAWVLSKLDRMIAAHNRRRSEWFDHQYEQARREVTSDRVLTDRPRHRDGESGG